MVAQVLVMNVYSFDDVGEKNLYTTVHKALLFFSRGKVLFCDWGILLVCYLKQKGFFLLSGWWF